jgi:DNA-directed RNA polymerase subunit RPC12/RpoP
MPVIRRDAEDLIRDELLRLGVTGGVDVMARRVRARLSAEGLLREPMRDDDLRPEDLQDRCVVCGSKVWPGESVAADAPVCCNECDERRANAR